MIFFNRLWCFFTLSSVGFLMSCSQSQESNTSMDSQQLLLEKANKIVKHRDSLNYLLYVGESQCAKCFYFILDDSYKKIRDRIYVVLYTDTSRIQGFKHYYLDADNEFKDVPGIHTRSYLMAFQNEKVVYFDSIQKLDVIKIVEERYR